jgi:hypothetical protein
LAGFLPNIKWGRNDTPSTPRAHEPRPKRGACSHALSGGWELEEGLHIWGRKWVF